MPPCGHWSFVPGRRWAILKFRTDEIEVTQALEPICLSDAESGVGLLIRRHGVPIGFVLRDVSAGSTLSAEMLGSWIVEELGSTLVTEAINDELSPTDRPSVTTSLQVVICTCNRPDTLKRCLDSLRQIQDDKGFSILVVDNAPSDKQTAALVEAYPGVRYTLEPRPGLDFARNRAWQEAEGEWVAYLDDDALVDSCWYDGLETVWREYPDAGAITGPVLPWELATKAQILFEKGGGFRRGFSPRRYGRVLPGNSLYPAGAGIFGTGANMAFRRDLLQELGGFDEALDTGAPLPGGGDLDIFFRVVNAGKILVHEPRFLVFHEHRKSLSQLRHQYYTWGLGLMAYSGKHLGRNAPQRTLFRGLVRWWFRHQLREIKERFRGRHPLPISMLATELWGGVIGICGEYRRSQRRIETIKRAHASPTSGGSSHK